MNLISLISTQEAVSVSGWVDLCVCVCVCVCVRACVRACVRVTVFANSGSILYPPPPVVCIRGANKNMKIAFCMLVFQCYVTLFGIAHGRNRVVSCCKISTLCCCHTKTWARLEG